MFRCMEDMSSIEHTIGGHCHQEMYFQHKNEATMPGLNKKSMAVVSAKFLNWKDGFRDSHGLQWEPPCINYYYHHLQ